MEQPCKTTPDRLESHYTSNLTTHKVKQELRGRNIVVNYASALTLLNPATHGKTQLKTGLELWGEWSEHAYDNSKYHFQNMTGSRNGVLMFTTSSPTGNWNGKHHLQYQPETPLTSQNSVSMSGNPFGTMNHPSNNPRTT